MFFLVDQTADVHPHSGPSAGVSMSIMEDLLEDH